MIEISRKQFKQDEVWRKLWQAIKTNHEVQEFEIKELYKNRHIKNFCIESRHFRVIDGTPNIFIHYDTNSWYNSANGAAVKIQAIGIYDDFNEYMQAYGAGMNSSDKRNLGLPEN